MNSFATSLFQLSISQLLICIIHINTVFLHFNLDALPRNEGLAAAGREAGRRWETASRRWRRGGLRGFLCAISRNCELIWNNEIFDVELFFLITT